jgi:hypothetical protein
MNRYSPIAIRLIEIANLIRYSPFAVGLKPSAIQGEARVRELEQIIYSFIDHEPPAMRSKAPACAG